MGGASSGASIIKTCPALHSTPSTRRFQVTKPAGAHRAGGVEEGGRHPQDLNVATRPTDDLETDRQAVDEAARHGNGRETEPVEHEGVARIDTGERVVRVSRARFHASVDGAGIGAVAYLAAGAGG